jgi:hypothetical protein
MIPDLLLPLVILAVRLIGAALLCGVVLWVLI